MNPKQRFSVALSAAGAVFNRDVNESLARIYFAALADLDLDRCTAALEKLIGTSKFMPKPAEIRDLVAGDVGDRALIAWGEVLTLAANSATAKHSDPDVEAAVAAMGGWRRIGMTDRSQLGFLQKEFRDHYGAKANRKVVESIGFEGVAQIGSDK
jgi:hypothetical protein